jgi:branched-chain amino acid aminotransferase
MEAYFQRRFIPLPEAKLGVMTHALHYGTACFEGIRGNWNKEEDKIYLFRSREHYQRLARSCRLLKIDLPYTVDELCDITVDLVARNGFHEDIYIRPLAYKSSEVVGVRLHDLEDDLLMFAVPFGPYLDVDKGVKCCISSWVRINDNMIPSAAKVSGRYVNSALAKTEAKEKGFDETIMLTSQGYVSEGSGENVFIFYHGQLITPPSSDDILIGITRDSIIRLAQEELGISTLERSVSRSDLYSASECFLTGTAAHITPVVEIDHYWIGEGRVGEVTRKLTDIYFDVTYGRNPRYSSWLTPVEKKVTKSVP